MQESSYSVSVLYYLSVYKRMAMIETSIGFMKRLNTNIYQMRIPNIFTCGYYGYRGRLNSVGRGPSYIEKN